MIAVTNLAVVSLFFNYIRDEFVLAENSWIALLVEPGEQIQNILRLRHAIQSGEQVSVVLWLRHF